MEAPEQSPGSGTIRDADTLSQLDLQALDLDRTVAFCAVSALEVHGPHLPIGSDYHQAIWMADETARRFTQPRSDWTAVRFPPLPIGTDELPLAGSINTPPRVVYRVVRAFGEQLARAGFRYVMLTNAHGGPRHAAALEAACRVVSRRSGISMFTPSIRALYQLTRGLAFDRVEACIGRDLSEAERAGLLSGEHAGGWETSWYLAKRPELVAPEFKSLPADAPPEFWPIARLGSWIAAGLARLGRSESAAQSRLVAESLAGGVGWALNSRFGYGRGGRRVSYHGAPAIASREIGEAYAEISVELCLEDLEAVTEGRLDALDVRSIASDPLLIQPHFPRVLSGVLGGIALLIALAVWAL
ncbi:MAG: creatininase family protein [Myxococcales bacterium]|nr:creatininase family protein [Myxococcales bacterium]